MTQKEGLRSYLSPSHDDPERGTEETTKNKKDNSADKQICTGLSNMHKYRPVNQTTLTGAIPFTPDSGSLPKDRPNGVH
jgi:hypothetical protein